MYEGYIRNQKNLLCELSLEEGASRRETEERIILKGFEVWGPDMALHLYGSFAIVLKDDDRLFCIRDAFGIEDLYYRITAKGELIYSSDIKTIARDPWYTGGIDPDALQLYCMFGYPAGEKTLFKGIRKLLPGRYLRFENGTAVTKIWFKPGFRPEDGTDADKWADEIEGCFEEILREDGQNLDPSECISFLSGGVDSSYLLATAGIQSAFTMDFEQASLRESVFAQETADALGAALNVLNITPGTYFDAIPQFLRCTGLPVVDSAGIAFYMGCKKIEKEITDKRILFSGEGADEFFAGYHVYKRYAELGMGDEPKYFGCDGVMPREEAMLLLHQETAFPVQELLQETFNPSEDALSHMLSADIALWLEGDILMCTKAARGCGLTPVLPYSDMRMFDISSRMPSGLKLKDDIGKFALRYAAERKLPKETVYRKKAGYLVPVIKWFRDPLYTDRIRSTIFGDTSRLFFDTRIMESYWERFLEDGTREFRIIFAVYIFVIWYETVYEVVCK